MSRKNSYITITDQFCGAGGSSQGARRVANKIGGVEIKLALNHWKLAIETHNTNFPETLHDCTDISACDPRRYPGTDILITSPECTNHSLAKGQKIVKKQLSLFDQGKLDPAAERSRATMWDVCRFAEYHKYRVIIVENVVDARKWLMWEPWLHAMDVLGYNYECVYHNSKHSQPTPQSRDRMYIVFWRKSQRAPNLKFTPEAFCTKCACNVFAIQTWKNSRVRFGKYDQQYVYTCPTCKSIVEPFYHAAFNCIDWSDKGQRIGDRKKRLADKTIARIEHGIAKHGNKPMIITTRYTSGIECRVKDATTDTLPTQPGDQSHAILTPFIDNSNYGGRTNEIDKSLPTQTGQQNAALVSMPLVLQTEHSSASHSGYVKSSAEALQSQTTCQGMSVFTPPAPFLTVMRGTSTSRAISDSLNGITAGGIHSGIVTSEAWHSFISSYYGGSHVNKHITQDLSVVRTGACHSLVNYQAPNIDDCYYRMLKPGEIKIGMAFDTNYVVLGTGRDQVKQLGNAVTPPVMEWLVERAIESLQ